MKWVLGRRSHVSSGITFTENFVKNEHLDGGRGTQARVPKKEASFLLSGPVAFFRRRRKEKRRDILAVR
jgi:hypothetical protein